MRDLVVVGAGPAGSPRPSTARPRGSTCSYSRTPRRAARRGRARRSRTTSAFRRGSRGRRSPGAPSPRRRSSAPRSAIGAERDELAVRRPRRLRDRAVGRGDGARAHAHHRERRAVSAPAPRQPRALRGRRRLLRRDRHRGAALRRRRGDRRRRRATPPGRRPCFWRGRRGTSTCSSAVRPRRDDVALSHPSASRRARTSRCRTRTEISALEGDDRLERVAWRGPRWHDRDPPHRGTCFS